MLADLQGQVSSLQGLASDLQGLASDLQGEKGKIRILESALGKLEAARDSWQMDLSNQLSPPLGSKMQEVKRDMKDLAEQQRISKAALDQLVTQTAEEEQEQLEELRVMKSTGQEEAVCPTCSSDTSMRLGKLLQCYEKLRGLVDSLMSSKKRGELVRQLPGKSQVGRWQHGGLGRGLPEPCPAACASGLCGGVPCSPPYCLVKSAAQREIQAMLQMSCWH
ncbi:uncharacterized protein LOC133224586 [Neopsephotus bourkii]|uniref:uncharacterized protein LOC133224586 n=1 Tax=Neopsephotus bourkii TaxID=309878 RepID=UPI002AA50268|nr:uncharacterized protein LOC133224586 [Neopsephotus bourkii]